MVSLVTDSCHSNRAATNNQLDLIVMELGPLSACLDDSKRVWKTGVHRYVR